ncbi:hypothetical protein PC128_g5203 [Phytophthora cactorum]|nr:hypothetical protein PC128_g5203 [Phytophthora cactorum]
MGMDVRNYPSTPTLKEWSPSEAGADLHKWKKKLRTAFGVRDISKGRQPVSRVAVQAANLTMVPLPETPANVDEGSRDFSDNVFSKGDESPYFPGLAHGYTTLGKPCATSYERRRWFARRS